MTTTSEAENSIFFKQLKATGKQILGALSKVDRPIDVCTSGDRNFVLPGLEVKEIGAVGFPLNKSQAKQLVKVCQQAPYGKGTKTVVDTDVRNVWELDPKRFKLKNKQWQRHVDSILDDVQEQLGLDCENLTAELYKLLVYEKGGFFLPHRDGEKLDGMVATLVIGLPSEYTGGQLIVFHQGKKHTIRMKGAATGLEMSYAAFYADCEHEVKPVKSGFRLCLTYNIVLAGNSKRKKQISAPDFKTSIKKISEGIGAFFETSKMQFDAIDNARRTDCETTPHEDNSNPPSLMAITLDHRYTQEGLSLKRLKGVDRSRVQAVLDAVDPSRFIAHLGLVTMWRHGSAEGDYEGYNHWEHDWESASDDDDDDDEDTLESVHEMGEIFDESLTISHWSDAKGTKVKLGDISITENEIISAQGLNEWEPSKEDYEGYTGNAGMTLERWYHRAAVVVWPREQHFRVLCNAGTDSAIGGLQTMAKKLARFKQGKPGSAPEKKRQQWQQECRDFTIAITDSWGPSFGQHYSSTTCDASEPIDRNVFCDVLAQLNDVALISGYIGTAMLSDGKAPFNSALARTCTELGWQHFADSLFALLGESKNDGSLNRNATLLKSICVLQNKTPENVKLFRQFAMAFVETLIQYDELQDESSRWNNSLDRTEVTIDFVKAMLEIDESKALKRFVDHALGNEAQYDLTSTHLAAIFKLKPKPEQIESSPQLKRWLLGCQSRLQVLTADEPQPPADFHRASDTNCSCFDCKALADFLANPYEASLRMPMAKGRRMHIHRIIDRQSLDCTHVTERIGRPYVLVCTKTMASAQAVKTIYDRDTNHLKKLEKYLKN